VTRLLTDLLDERYNRDEFPLTLGGTIPVQSGNTFLPVLIASEAGKAIPTPLSNFTTAPAMSAMQQRLDAFRAQIQNALTESDPDEIDRLYADEATRKLLSGRHFNNERYALRDAFNANRRKERRVRRKDLATIAKECEVVLTEGIAEIEETDGDRTRIVKIPVDVVQPKLSLRPEEKRWPVEEQGALFRRRDVNGNVMED
jgi:hypothetical protein